MLLFTSLSKAVRNGANNYAATYKGLSKEIWWLALITFINRAGTMVLPFLTLYLQEDLRFSLSQVGTVMVVFGFGSLAGSFIGGKLTDRIGYYKVMVGSLFLTGISFLILQYIDTFIGFCIGIFFTMVIADTFRPAMFVSMKSYSKPENTTRSLTLIRLAINLGFSFGPFLGGIIIAALDYNGLFWVDGITCILAVSLLFTKLNPKKRPNSLAKENLDEDTFVPKTKKDNTRNILIFAVLMLMVFLMAVSFLQMFSILPLYYRNEYQLEEWEIGLFMSMNGLLIFILEMPLIHYIEKKLISKVKMTIFSLAMMLFSFLFFNFGHALLILVISMILITFGEMFSFPFTNKIAMDRATKGKEGKYMAMYTMAFSFAHIISGKLGTFMVENYGFEANWYLMSILLFVSVLLGVILKKGLDMEKQQTTVLNENLAKSAA
ncbi:MDR family MFS transporter [Aureivirga sp. CE67]|uniref:MDR family MFS transporter n=1 Tax=Aureivirga sp. CE67 TaxID=1788983 RepID=UPI0018CA5657|nr:MFS transporter [Aureivirga sp. CE67]